MPSRFSDFKIARRWNSLNRLVQVTLSISLVLALNFLASQTAFQGRWNLSSDRQQTLSLETRKYLESIGNRMPKSEAEGQPWVRVYVTLSPDSLGEDSDAARIRALKRHLNQILDDFSFEIAKNQRTRGWLKVEQADRIKNAGVWTELASRSAALDPLTALVVACGNNYKYIKLSELIRVRANAQGDPVIDAYRGEEILINALLSVTNDKPPVVYLTIGHGEMLLDDTSSDRGLSSFKLQLQARNLDLKPLDLSKYNEVPTNADLIVVASPRYAFTPQEVEKLSRYMRDRSGRMIALVDVGVKSGLDDLFYNWGIIADDARVIDQNPDATAPNKDLMLHMGAKDHPVTSLVKAAGAPLVVGMARPVRFDMGSPIDDTLQVLELVGTSAQQSWGERDYQRDPPYQFNHERGDLLPPVSVAAVAERVAGRKQNISIAGGRLLVIGSGDVAANSRINEQANLSFLLNSVNWMLDRDQFLNIPPRPAFEFKLNATGSDLNRVAWRFLLLPGAMLLLGFGVFLWRRST